MSGINILKTKPERFVWKKNASGEYVSLEPAIISPCNDGESLCIDEYYAALIERSRELVESLQDMVMVTSMNESWQDTSGQKYIERAKDLITLCGVFERHDKS